MSSCRKSSRRPSRCRIARSCTAAPLPSLVAALRIGAVIGCVDSSSGTPPMLGGDSTSSASCGGSDRPFIASAGKQHGRLGRQAAGEQNQEETFDGEPEAHRDDGVVCGTRRCQTGPTYCYDRFTRMIASARNPLVYDPTVLERVLARVRAEPGAVVVFDLDSTAPRQQAAPGAHPARVRRRPRHRQARRHAQRALGRLETSRAPWPTPASRRRDRALRRGRQAVLARALLHLRVLPRRRGHRRRPRLPRRRRASPAASSPTAPAATSRCAPAPSRTSRGSATPCRARACSSS